MSLLLVLFLAPRGFCPGIPVFPSPQKPTFLNSNSIWNCQALYHEPLARVIAQALSVFDIKFEFYIYKRKKNFTSVLYLRLGTCSDKALITVCLTQSYFSSISIRRSMKVCSMNWLLEIYCAYDSDRYVLSMNDVELCKTGVSYAKPDWFRYLSCCHEICLAGCFHI